MRVPPFHRYSSFLRSGAIFLCGMIVGAAVYNSIFHFQVNQLTTIRSELLTQIGQQEEEIKSLSKYKNKQTIIRTLQLFILDDPDTPIDTHSENELKRKIKTDLDGLIGRDIYKINSDAILTQKLLKNKTYQDSRGQEYNVQIRTMLANDGILQIWIDAKAKTDRP
ncbi:hypothetical protein BVG16_00550 [Paenibacillus selenitireducens]|uniref:Sporulation membrane protein YtrI C-terminal domain-containing protein n=1 Tax=Paenibacillus selenitireducens TaxID=1324314 RepID=A0A1T2XLX3_9BACL|nr:hypothetical protein BVG16_00550 [Paenibacillus selenitireducens]